MMMLPKDIVSRFVEFVKVCFRRHTLIANLGWIATALGKTSGETSKRYNTQILLE